MDDTYQVYVNRVTHMTLPDAYKAQVQYIQSSPKFIPDGNDGFQAVPFPGYSVITPPWVEDPSNANFYKQVQACQHELVKALPKGLVIPLPAESFHMTLADLIWNDAYRHALKVNEDFEPRLRHSIHQIFQRCEPLVQGADPVTWQVIGLIVMPRAIALALAPKAERSYARVTELRRSLYQNMELINLGIEQQYHLTGHITLGYFGDISTLPDANTFSAIISELNQPWIENEIPQEIHVHHAELRKFENMMQYNRENDWPVLSFDA